LRRNCLLKHIIAGNIERGIEVMGGKEWRLKQLLSDLKQTRWYWKLYKEAPYRNIWRTRFERGYWSVVRQTTEWMNEWIYYI
jgi:hypothetical protein